MYLLHFNGPDKPKDMGQSQKTDNVSKFAGERQAMLPNWEIEKDGKKLTFDVTEENPNFDAADPESKEPRMLTRRGYAIITEVADDFEN